MRLPARRHGAAAAFGATARPGSGTPWREARWCAIDLELTGLDPRKDEIIAIGAVPIDDGRLILGQSVYTLVSTSVRSELAAVVLHKLRVADLTGAPPLAAAIELVLGVLAGRVPVFHTAAVERAFLRPQFTRRRVRLPDAADTDVLGRLWLRERDGVVPAGLSLTRLARVLSLPAEPPHHALGDALTTAKAFIALAALLDARSSQTVGSLRGAADQLRGPRRL